MDIYVQSRGRERDYDYRWLQIGSDGSTKRQIPPLSGEAIDLIDSDALSVLWERLESDKIILLIAGIEPDDRVDVLGRQIRILIAWVGSNSDEPVLRSIAARVLNSKEQEFFIAEINEAVRFGGEEGFQVDLEKMSRLHREDIYGEAVEKRNDKIDPAKKYIAPNTTERKNELASLLLQSSLPTETGAIIVVTGIIEREALSQARVWRGLSTMVETEDGDWEELPPAPDRTWEDIYQEILRQPLPVMQQILSYLLAQIKKLVYNSKESRGQKGEDETS